MKKKNPNTKAALQKAKSKLARKALRLWFELGSLAKGGKCEVCGATHGVLNEKGKPQWLNGHHIEDKTNYATRFDPLNHVLLCPTCHKFGLNAAHRSPLWFIQWLRTNQPEKADYLLRARIAMPSSLKAWETSDLQSVVDRLTAAIERIK